MAKKKAKEKVIIVGEETEEQPEEDTSSMDGFLSDLVEQYRDTTTVVESGSINTEFIDSGNLALNFIATRTFDGCIPENQLTEIHGDPSTGKSLLVHIIMANFLKKHKNAIAILDDTEFAFVEYFGSKIGMDTSRFIRLSSSTVEDHARTIFLGKRNKDGRIIKPPMVETILKHDPDMKILVALDSVASLSTDHEMGIGLEKPDMGKAKVIKAMMRSVVPIIKQHNITYIATNHLIFNIGDMFGPAKVTPGGGGIPFQSSMRLNLASKGQLKLDCGGKKADAPVIGVATRVKTVKNRFSPPFQFTDVVIDFENGLDPYSGLAELLVRLGALEIKTGGWHTFGNIKFYKKDLPKYWEKIKEKFLKEKLHLVRDGEAVVEENE